MINPSPLMSPDELELMQQANMECSKKKYIPMFIMVSLIIEVVTLCLRNWIEGYYGDVIVLTLCPWRLCHLNCLECSQQKPTMGCFWIDDWEDTGFGEYIGQTT